MKKICSLLLCAVAITLLLSGCQGRTNSSLFTFSTDSDGYGVYLKSQFPAAPDAMVLYEASAGEVSDQTVSYTNPFWLSKATLPNDASRVCWTPREETDPVIYLRAIFFLDQKKISPMNSQITGDPVGYCVLKMTRQKDGRYTPSVLVAREYTGFWHPSEKTVRKKMAAAIKADGGKSDFPYQTREQPSA